MMIEVIAKHFLTPEGIQYFEKTWFSRMKKVLETKAGFVSFTFETFTADPYCEIKLRFDTLENLQAWGRSQEHSDILAELDPFRTKPLEAMRHEV